jgi:P-type E1-E2 ATPase
VVAFDKTGTLTLGHPHLTDLVLTPGVDRVTVLSAAAAVEARSEHPVGRAIVDAARAEGVDVSPAQGVVAQPGLGLSGQVGGRRVAVGSARFLQDMGIGQNALRTEAEALSAQAKSVVWVAIDGALAGVLAVADALRPQSLAAVRALQARGLRVVLVSGDTQPTAKAVAASLGIDEVHAEVLPGAKRDIVQGLRRAHGTVAFVGDGINDAPALAEADVGIAIGTGTDIAIEAADVVLMSGNPSQVAVAIGLSQATMTNISQNLFWAFAYNAALIPVAAGVLYPGRGILLSPALAAGAMALSSLFVVGNALRLSRYGKGALA